MPARKKKCEKRRFATEDAARRELAIIGRKWAAGQSKRLETRFYWCKPCRAYHTTSKPVIKPRHVRR